MHLTRDLLFMWTMTLFGLVTLGMAVLVAILALFVSMPCWLMLALPSGTALLVIIVAWLYLLAR